MNKLAVSMGGSLKGQLLHWKTTTKRREWPLQSAMDRTSPNELKMSTGKVQVKHWRRRDKNPEKKQWKGGEAMEEIPPRKEL